MTYSVKDILDTLFADAELIMKKLSDEHDGAFSSQQFIKAVARNNQVAYVELLSRCLEHPDAQPFNIAHQHIGRKLSQVATEAGYDGPYDEGRTETDIFGNPTGRKVFRRIPN